MYLWQQDIDSNYLLLNCQLNKSDMNFELVSVVVATYNGEKFLREQLDSVINQTHLSLEIIIADDCSTDNTWPIIEAYRNKDSRIKAYRNESNVGYTRNFENAILASKGKYIAFCDQDDIWRHDKIEILLNHIHDSLLCFSDSDLIDEKGMLIGRKLSDLKNVQSYANCLPFVIGNCVPGHACIVNRDALLKALPFPTSFVYDWWLSFYFSCISKIIFVDIPLVHYRQHQGNSVAAIKIEGAKRKKISKEQKLEAIRSRMDRFYQTALAFDIPEKDILRGLHESYQNFSLKNNLLRALLFFRYQKSLLALKKRNRVRKWFFCFKMFFTIQ
jgi:glycosyltransferase involved in cell wall biosynthesis